MQPYDCVIIGAGASGLLAASLLETPPGWRGLILEASGKPGSKLLLTGGGRCNFTHDGPIRDFVPHYAHGRQIRTALYRHSNGAFREFLSAHGVPSVTEEDGRVFPASESAAEILNLLLSISGQNRFSIRTDSRVTGITAPEDGSGLYSVRTGNGESFLCRSLVAAAGGCTYPKTGSDGSMLEVLQRDTGLAVTPLYPSLQPVRVRDYPYEELAGVTLPGCGLTLETVGRKPVRTQGDLLLTHRELSGPAVLNLSRHLAESARASGQEDASKKVYLVLNYLRPQTRQEVQAQLQDARQRSRAEWSAVLSGASGLPRRFCQKLIERSRTAGGEVSVRKLAGLLTEDRFEVEPHADWSRAMVTSGGVALEEVDLRTMECRKHSGLYVIGEALDADGDTGGYNLQWAFSSAAAAAAAISEHMFASEEHL